MLCFFADLGVRQILPLAVRVQLSLNYGSESWRIQGASWGSKRMMVVGKGRVGSGRKVGSTCSPIICYNRIRQQYISMGSTQNKPILLAHTAPNDPLPESLTQALLVLVNGETYSVFVDTSLKGREVKELIYEKVSKTLAPKEMVLELNQRRVREEEQMEGLPLRNVIVQKKVPLNQISSIEAFSKIEDSISLEEGVIKMPCGHLIGRASIMGLLQTVADEKRWEVLCPFEGCGEEWSYALCRKVGALTQEEDRRFTEQFTQNWLSIHTRVCPGCGHAVMRGAEERSKVRCSNAKCRLGYFCFQCFKPWRSSNFVDCGNEECSFRANASLLEVTKEVKLTSKEGEEVVVRVPQMRLCPSCGLLIEHNEGCKHMRCYNCKKEFCWVCLALLKKTWPCGSYSEYCGLVAPVQQIAK